LALYGKSANKTGGRMSENIDVLEQNRKSIIVKEKVLRKAKEKVEKKVTELATATQELEAAKQDYFGALDKAKSVGV
jgi:hypothetical protein